MRKRYEKEKKLNIKIYIFMLIACLVLSCVVEIFGFNFKYWMNKKEIKDQRLIIEKELFELHDIERDGDNFKIVGDDPYFKINYDGYCNYLCVETSKDQEEYHINVQHIKKGQVIDEKNHVIGNIYKDESVLELKDNMKNIKFIPQLSNSEEAKAVFSIEQLEIDNSFVINYYRIAALFISGALILSIICYWKYQQARPSKRPMYL